jgi:hypothetical protein
MNATIAAEPNPLLLDWIYCVVVIVIVIVMPRLSPLDLERLGGGPLWHVLWIRRWAILQL